MHKLLKKYLFNCFLLFLPILIWDAFLTDKLPVHFQSPIFLNNTPVFLKIGENILRILLFATALLMPIKEKVLIQKKGLMLYLIGLFLYFLSWILLIYFPTSDWSTSGPGFLAPAYTPLLWLIGIGAMGTRFYFGIPFHRLIFVLFSIFFVVFHCIHTYIVFVNVTG
jgi:hypothetical protein